MSAAVVLWTLLWTLPNGHVWVANYRTEQACRQSLAHLDGPRRGFAECARTPLYDRSGNPTPDRF